MRIHLIISFVLSFYVFESGTAQIITESYDTTFILNHESAFFFTNRPVVIKKDSTITFKNKSTKRTNSLYFCLFNYESDSIIIKYKATNTSRNFPTGKVENNIFYDIYNDLTVERGLKNYYIIIPGYGKTFKNQVYSFMKRLKSTYGDTLFNKAAFITFAWGTETHISDYYSALVSSKRAAHDFAIFQNMLEDFLSDTVYLNKHPHKITLDILCASMGNHVFLNYIRLRKKNKIPLVKTYNRLLFLGSSAPRNSFEPGKSLDNLDQITDSVDVFVNYFDVPLSMASLFSGHKVMGNYGPLNPELLPPYIKIRRVWKVLSAEDIKGLGHDYFFRNPIVKEQIIENINRNADNNNK